MTITPQAIDQTDEDDLYDAVIKFREAYPESMLTKVEAVCPNCERIKAYYEELLAIASEQVPKGAFVDSRCKKHGVAFDYINGKPVCPICN